MRHPLIFITFSHPRFVKCDSICPRTGDIEMNMTKCLCSGSSEPIRNCRIKQTINIVSNFGEMDFPED